MGNIRPPEIAQLFCGVIFNSAADLDSLRSELEAAFGPIDMVSERFVFNDTDYYVPEMGAELYKIFYSFHNLIDQAELADAKLRTNEIELRLSQAAGSENRIVNLDPGYLLNSKILLATTKDYSHRIYIGKSIYAEVTLYFTKKTFNPHPWTYPDFKRPEYIEFFNKLRENYREKLKIS